MQFRQCPSRQPRNIPDGPLSRFRIGHPTRNGEPTAVGIGDHQDRFATMRSMAKLYSAFPTKRMKPIKNRDRFTRNVGFVRRSTRPRAMRTLRATRSRRPRPRWQTALERTFSITASATEPLRRPDRAVWHKRRGGGSRRTRVGGRLSPIPDPRYLLTRSASAVARRAGWTPISTIRLMVLDPAGSGPSD